MSEKFPSFQKDSPLDVRLCWHVKEDSMVTRNRVKG